ncbi:MAG TPA: sugar phosphate isomerase/epimerase [Vicinamibacterales bacterium]|jgi:sugar phosphate isomerase/epimerase
MTTLSRRAFLGASAAAPLALASALHGARDVPVGLELYSVRTELAKDLLGTVAAVGKMGYTIVEFYAPYLDWTPDKAKDVRRVLDDSGLVCHSTHNNGPSFTADGLKKAIELNQIIGSRAVIMASAPRSTTIDAWKAVADQLTATAAQLTPLGMATGYHNHQIEWQPVDGTRPIDVLAANTPKNVVLQFDVGTCVEVGADPIAWITTNPGRIKSVHCKDWSASAGYHAAFGEGDAPWKAIFAAAEAAGGVEYYLIEQETGNEQGGELPMARRCLDNWKRLAH